MKIVTRRIFGCMMVVCTLCSGRVFGQTHDSALFRDATALAAPAGYGAGGMPGTAPYAKTYPNTVATAARPANASGQYAAYAAQPSTAYPVQRTAANYPQVNADLLRTSAAYPPAAASGESVAAYEGMPASPYAGLYGEQADMDDGLVTMEVPDDAMVDPGYAASPRAPCAAPGCATPGCAAPGCASGCAAPAGIPPSCQGCGCGSCEPPLWSVRQGTRILTRNRTRPNFLTDEASQIDQYGAPVQSTNPLTGQPVPLPVRLTAGSASFDVAAGYTLTVDRYLGRDTENRDQFLEFTYWGLNHWDQSITVEGTLIPNNNTNIVTGSLFSAFPVGIGGFNRAETHSLEYSSEIHNFEWGLRLSPRGRKDRLVLHPDGSWRRECQPGCYVSYLFGLRFMTLDESSHFSSRGAVSDNGTLGSISGDYDVFSQNDLLGLQFGTDLTWRRCRGSWGMDAKFVPFINWMHQASSIRSSDPDPTFVLINKDLEAQANEAGFIGELGVHGNYRVKPNLVVGASYDMMWILGLALAPEQMVFDADPQAKVNANGRTFMHGLTLTAEFGW